MIRNEENQENSILPFLQNLLAEDRGQVQFCQNPIANSFEKVDSPCKREIPEVKSKDNSLTTI